MIGGGNTAVEEALYLANLAAKVTIVHRRDNFRAERILQDRLFAHPKVEVVWDHAIDEILGPRGACPRRHPCPAEERQDGRRARGEGGRHLRGHRPQARATELFVGRVLMTPSGYIDVTPGRTTTNIPGVFAAGDVADEVYRQAVTASAAWPRSKPSAGSPNTPSNARRRSETSHAGQAADTLPTGALAALAALAQPWRLETYGPLARYLPYGLPAGEYRPPRGRAAQHHVRAPHDPGAGGTSLRRSRRAARSCIAADPRPLRPLTAVPAEGLPAAVSLTLAEPLGLDPVAPAEIAHGSAKSRSR